MVTSRRQSLEQILQLVRPSDVINFIFIFFLLLLTLLFAERVKNWYLLSSLYGGMLLLVGCLIWFCRESSRPTLLFLRSWYPLVFVIVTFFSLSGLVHHVFPYDVDSELIAIDFVLLGGHPTVYLSQFLNPYLVDLLEICYASFYFLPLVLGFSVYFKRKMSEFEVFAAVICLGFYLSDVGNLIFPARGPSQTLAHLHTIPLEGKWVGNFIRTILFTLEPYRWDCFPSGHVAVTLITLILSYRFERRIFWFMLPIGTGLILSTVFLRYHYVVDVIAGAVLAVALLASASLGQRFWNRLKQPRMAKVLQPSYWINKDIS